MKLNKQGLLLAMARAQVTDKELCERSGVAIPTLSQLKRGRNNPKPATVGRLANALHIPVEELIDREA